MSNEILGLTNLNLKFRVNGVDFLECEIQDSNKYINKYLNLKIDSKIIYDFQKEILKKKKIRKNQI